MLHKRHSIIVCNRFLLIDKNKMSFSLLTLAVFILFVQPVYIFPELAEISPVKNVLIISLLVYVVFGDKSDYKFLDSKTNKYFLLFVAIQLFVPMTSWVGSIKDNVVNWLLYVITYYLIVKQCITIARIRKISLMIILAMSYLSYFSISKFITTYEPGARAGGFGWYENSNDLAIILVVAISLALFLAETATVTPVKLLYYGFAGVFVFNILFTGSRSGLMALCTVLFLGLKFSRNLSSSVKSFVAVVLLIAVVGTGLSVVLNRKDLNSLHGDDSSENRLVQWEAGLRMVLAKPFLGVGPDQFKYVAGNYQGINDLEPHNTLIQVFAETGVPGGVVFVIFACSPLYASFQKNKEMRGKVLTDAGITLHYLFIALSGFWMCAFFSNRYRSYILFVLIALLISVKDYLLVQEEL